MGAVSHNITCVLDYWKEDNHTYILVIFKAQELVNMSWQKKNHRMGKVGRFLTGSSCPTFLLKKSHPRVYWKCFFKGRVLEIFATLNNTVIFMGRFTDTQWLFPSVKVLYLQDIFILCYISGCKAILYYAFTLCLTNRVKQEYSTLVFYFFISKSMRFPWGYCDNHDIVIRSKPRTL